MNERTKIFNAVLRDTIKPELIKRGFKFDNNRTFRKIDVTKRTCRIINLQLGQRFLEGEFTVNLAVYDESNPIPQLKNNPPELDKVCEYQCQSNLRIRIGFTMNNGFLNKLYRKYFGAPAGRLSYRLFGTKDKWWPIGKSEADTRKSMNAALEAILKSGLPWLEEHSQ